MPTNEPRRARLWDLRRLPQDLARLVCLFLPLIFRLKRVTPTGEAYRGKLRGGAVIAANHTSFADPFVVGITFWHRRMFFLMAETVMKGRLRSLLLRGVGGIRIDRGAPDLEAIKRSVSLLKEGRILTVFPQGSIVKEDDVDAIKSGAVLIALQAGVPLVPVHICPRAHWYCRRRVVIGEALHPRTLCSKKLPSTADITAITHTLMTEMNRCNPQTDGTAAHQEVEV